MKWIIAIDESAEASHETSAAMGWTVFCDGDMLSHGELTPDPETGFTRVRNWLRNKIKAIRQNDPKDDITVATESVFLGPNPARFAGLLRVQSHIEAVALDASCRYAVVSPQESFRAATGLTQYPLNSAGKRSGTRKPAIRAHLQEKYGFDVDTSEHEVDAAAIGLAIVQRYGKE